MYRRAILFLLLVLSNQIFANGKISFLDANRMWKLNCAQPNFHNNWLLLKKNEQGVIPGSSSDYVIGIEMLDDSLRIYQMDGDVQGLCFDSMQSLTLDKSVTHFELFSRIIEQVATASHQEYISSSKTIEFDRCDVSYVIWVNTRDSLYQYYLPCRLSNNDQKKLVSDLKSLLYDAQVLRLVVIKKAVSLFDSLLAR